jgi:aspartate aminotransferase
VSCGGKQSFYNLAQALLNSGDEVIIPGAVLGVLPGHGAAGRWRAGDCRGRHRAAFQDHCGAIGSGDHPAHPLMVINSPSNPTGVAYNAAELSALGEVLRRHPQVYIATDDMYEHILWTGEKFTTS